MAYGLLLGNMTWDFFYFQTSTNAGLSFIGDSSFAFSFVSSTTNLIQGSQVYIGDSSFNLNGALFIANGLSFVGDSNMGITFRNIDQNPIIGTVEFYLIAPRRFGG